MFYYLKGSLEYVGDGIAVIDCGGVGYKLNVSGTTVSALSRTAPGLSPTVKLYTYFAVREDAAELFGFYTVEELDTFKLLISISGIGPKAAMAILSQLSPQALADAVASQNVKLISRAPGVGTKTAQRVVLELSGKLTVLPSTGAVRSGSAAPKSTALSEAQDALVVLGYSRSEAQSALSAIDGAETKTTEELIRLALPRLI